MGSALFGFAYTPQAITYLKTLQTKFRKQITKKINALAGNPFPPSSRVVRCKMGGDCRVHRIRSGVYRVLYSVRENPSEIVILDIGHRKDVYR